MLVIRLSRTGRTNMATFRIIVQEKARSPKSAALEILGSYNPHLQERSNQIILDQERTKYWLSKGAQPSITMHNMLVELGIIDAPKRRSVQPKLKKKEGEEGAEGGAKPAEEKKDEKPKEDKKE
ncbi:MAG: 30S ribosomal protein S16 [Candidatus Kerfeldbacteria bacterium]